MKKIYLPLFLVVGLTSQAQILTNSNPAATITGSSVILDASTNYSQQAGESNNKHKGMVIPSVDLVNFEFDMTLADGATFPTYFDGMIVYNRSTGTTLTAGNRSSTATAVVPGYYYFYNPSGSVNGNVKGGQWRSVANDATATSKGVVQLAGDLTGTSESPTIANNAVTSTKILDDTVANVDLATGAGGIYKGNGSLSGNTTVNQGSNTLAFTSNVTNGFSVDGNTFSVDALNNRIGIGTSSPHGTLQFASNVQRRRIVFWEDHDNDHQFVGIGTDGDINGGIFRFQLPSSGTRFAFFTGTSASSSNEIMSIHANGNVGIGTSVPGVKLELNNGTTPGAIKIVDGTQGAGKVLVSDANGVGTWQTASGSYTGSTSNILNGSSFERAALTGDVTAPQNSNTTTISANAVTSAKILDGTVANVDLAAGAGGIYKGNGTLSGNTFVDQGSNTLTFISNAVNGFSVAGNTLSVDGANARVGIGNSGPRARLSFSQTLENKKIALWDDAVFVDDVHQYYGFGVNNSMLRYQVGNLTARHAFFAAINGGASIELMTINGNGNVGVGISSPTSKFEVNGAATNSGAFNAGLATTIDFSLSNLAYTLANPGNTFTLNNLKNGGTYSLAVRGGTSGTASFSASGFTFKSSSNGPTTAGKETVYTFLVMGTTVYVYMNSGL